MAARPEALNTAAPVIIQQALHGYRDGHRLLASSVELSRVDQQAMLALSDSADAGSGPDFPHLLTGYPLPSSTYYVIAMTWPAPEQTRPGCVWTHSLLLGADEVASIVDPCALLTVMRRPEIADADVAAPYSRPIVLEAASDGQSLRLPEEFLQTLVWALYEPPASPVAAQRIPLPPNARERLLLKIWGQQWPSLRSRFAFAEAPLVPRQVAGDLFDLQFTRSPQRGLWDQGENVRVVRGPLKITPPIWCQRVANDLAKPSKLRDFLVAWGPQTDGTREAFSALARVWTASQLRNAGWADQLVDTTNRVFPNGQAPGIRNALLGPDSERAPSDEIELLLALLRAPTSAVGKPQELAVRTRASVAAETGQGSACLLDGLTREPGRTPVARELVAGLTEGMHDGDLRDWVGHHSELLPKLLKKHPQLATRGALWMAANPDEILTGLQQARVGRRLQEEIVGALVRSGAVADVPGLIAHWPAAAAVIVDELASGAVDDPAQRRSLAMAIEPDHVAAWLSSHDAADELLRIVADVWTEDSLARLPSKAWAGFASIENDFSNDARVRLFAAASRCSDPAAAELGILLFSELYGAALADQLDPASRGTLRALAPEVPTWDSARQLARVANHALKNVWPLTAAFGVTNEDGFAAIVGEDGKAGLARRLALKIAAEPNMAAGWQQDIVAATVVDKADRDSLAKLVEGAFKLIKKLG